MKRASSADRPDDVGLAGRPPSSNGSKAAGRLVWLGVSLGFLVLVIAWVIAFHAAHQAQIREVPLATKEARP